MSDYRQQQESEEEELWIIEMEAQIAALVSKENQHNQLKEFNHDAIR